MKNPGADGDCNRGRNICGHRPQHTAASTDPRHSRYNPEAWARVIKTLTYCLTLGFGAENWHGLTVVLTARLTMERRAALGWAALRALPPDIVVKTANAALAALPETTRPPIPPLFSYMDEARFWADHSPDVQNSPFFHARVDSLDGRTYLESASIATFVVKLLLVVAAAGISADVAAQTIENNCVTILNEVTGEHQQIVQASRDALVDFAQIAGHDHDCVATYVTALQDGLNRNDARVSGTATIDQE